MSEASEKLITVIGRGHGGTRAIASTLRESGVYTGEPLNKSDDLLPPEPMYEACRVFARYVKHRGGLAWDFERVWKEPVDPAFERLIRQYLESVLRSDAPAKGWKIPETTLCFPWIQRLFPDAYFIRWSRDPRDAILKPHKTDDLREFGIEYPEPSSERERRAISWFYQAQLIRATPAPERVIDVRFEDFVQDQGRTLERLEGFLGMPLARIPVDPEAVGRWRSDEGPCLFDFMKPEMQRLGYWCLAL
jgi:hypothetical protein